MGLNKMKGMRIMANKKIRKNETKNKALILKKVNLKKDKELILMVLLAIKNNKLKSKIHKSKQEVVHPPLIGLHQKKKHHLKTPTLNSQE